jgi:hypothetical protein
MPPRKRRGGGRRTVSPRPTTWSDDAYALWREGWSVWDIAALIEHRWNVVVAPAVVERLVHDVAVSKLRASLASG